MEIHIIYLSKIYNESKHSTVHNVYTYLSSREELRITGSKIPNKPVLFIQAAPGNGSASVVLFYVVLSIVGLSISAQNRSTSIKSTQHKNNAWLAHCKI